VTARLTTRRLKRSVAAGAAALTLLAAAGCGGDEDSSASDTSSSSASAETSTTTSPSEDASPSEEASSEGDTGAAEGDEISAEEFGSLVEKALDEATTANVTIESSAGGIGGLTGQGQIDYDSEPPAVKMTASIAQSGDIDMVLADNELYLKGAMFGGQKWVKLSLDDPNSPLSAFGDQLDPAASLEKLVKGVQKATYVGEEDVDGDQLDHYTATVDTKSLLEDLPAEAQSAAGLPPTVDYQVWFDGDGLLRKFSVDMGGTIGTSSGTFSDWGTDVDIEAPAASEVTEMPGLGGSSAG
jgi:hypothetical protein